MGGVKRCTPVNVQGVRGLLKLLLTDFLFIPFITLIITDFLLLVSSRFSFIPKGLAEAICSITSALTASDILTLFLVTLLIFCSLSLNKLLNLITLLKVVAFGLMNLAIWPITFPGFVGSRDLPTVSTHDSVLAGDLGLGLLAGTRCTRSFDSHHSLILPLLTALLALLLTS